MNYNEVNEKLKQLKIEDFIWIIYVGIIYLSWLSNHYEKDYFVNNNEESKEIYRSIMIIIFTVLTIIYAYFLYDSYNGIKNLKPWQSNKSKDLNYLSFIASLLIFISGIIFLYIALEDEELNVELAFN